MPKRRPTPPNTQPFIIRRADVEELIGACPLIDIFDRSRSAHSAGLGLDGAPLPDGAPRAEEGAISLAAGWTDRNTQSLLDASPRAFWLMARAGLIPVSEKEALDTILSSGKRIERQRFPTAQVQTLPESSVVGLRMRAMISGRMRLNESGRIEIVRVR